MPDEKDKQTGPQAPAQNAPGPENAVQPNGLQWQPQSGQTPDLFANVPGYQPHSFGQPVAQPAPTTPFAQQPGLPGAQTFAQPAPQQYAQPVPQQFVQPAPQQAPQQFTQPVPPQFAQAAPQPVPQPLTQPQQQYAAPQNPNLPFDPNLGAPGYIMPGQAQPQIFGQPQTPTLPEPAAEIPQLKLPPKPPSQQKPMSQMLPYQYQYQSQQGNREPQLQPQYTPERSPQFGNNQNQQSQSQPLPQSPQAIQPHVQQGQMQPVQMHLQQPMHQGQMQPQSATAASEAERAQQAQAWQLAQQQWQLQPKTAEQMAQEQASLRAQQERAAQQRAMTQGQPQPQQYAQGQPQLQGQPQPQQYTQAPQNPLHTAQHNPQRHNPNQQYQPTPRPASTNYAGTDAGRAPNAADQVEARDFVPKTPPVINTGDPNKPWASNAEPQFELFAEEYEEAIRLAQKAREQSQDTAPAKPSVWQEKLAEAAAATEVPQARVIPLPQSAVQSGAEYRNNGGQSALGDALDTVAAPQMSRGAAALRAAGLYNKGNEPKELDPSVNSGFKINKQDLFGLIAYNLLIAKTICTDPRGFFAKMPEAGPVAEPLIFLLVIEIVGQAARCVTSFSVKPLFADLIMSLISTILGAVIVALVFDKVGGKGNFTSTLRVLCFSKAPMLVAFLGFAQFQLGSLAALVYGVYLNYLGLSKTQKVDKKTTIIIIAALAFLGACFRGNAP